MSAEADRERHRRAMELFERACDLGESERAALLDVECARDGRLRAEVETLLAEDGAGPDTFVGSELAESASRMARDLAERGAAPSELTPPECVGSFRVLGRLGHGGSSLVYEAEQASPRRRVALKILRAGLATVEETARFQREVEVLGRLDHPGIARIFDSGVLEPTREGEDARPWFAMELVGGQPVTRHADEAGLDWRERCRLLAAACEAVHHAHVKGVIHRDLKPGNMLVDAEGRPRIVDFGVASAEDELARGDLRTRRGVLLGTLQYMAPEQARGDASEADVRSDVYALGLVAFELLARRPARDLGDQSIASATRTVLDSVPPRLGQVVPELAGDPEAVVRKATQDDPEMRYQSAQALADDLRALASGEPVAARPPTAWAEFRRLVRRRREVFTVAGIGIAALALLTVYAGWQALRAERARADEARQRAAAERSAHRASLAAAQLALETGDVGMLRRRLDAVPEPARDWAWHHLDARADDSLLAWPGNGNRTRRLVFDSRQGLAAWGEAPPLAGEQRAVLWDLRANALLHRRNYADADAEIKVPERALELVLASLRMPREHDRLRILSEEDGRLLAEIQRCEGTLGAYQSFAAGELRLHLSDGEIQACDPETGEVRARGRCRGCMELRVDPTGGHAFALRQHGRVEVHALDTLERLATLKGHHEGVRELAVAPDGTRVVTASRDGTLRWWSLPDGREVGRRAPHRGSVDAVAFSPCGQFVASTGDDGAIRIWDAQSQLEVAVLLGHVAGPSGLAFSADGRRLLSMGRDGGRLWWIGDRVDPRAWRGHESYVYDLALSPDGSLLASVSWDGNLQVRSLVDGSLVRTFRPRVTRDDYPLAVAWSPDGRRLVSTTKRVSERPWRSFLQAWDLESGEQLADVDLGSGHPLDLGFTASGDEVLVGCGAVWTVVDTGSWETDGRIRARAPDLRPLGERGIEHDEPWCPTEPEPRRALREDGERLLRSALARPGFANAVSLSPEGDRWAFGLSGRVVVMRSGTGGVVASHDFGPRRVYALSWDSTGENLFLGTDDSLLRVLEPDSLDVLLTLDGHANYIKSLVVVPESDAVYTGSGDWTVRLWDHRSAAQLHAGR